MSMHYELNCGQYVMFRDGAPVTRPLDEVALALAVDGTLHKHGEPSKVAHWFNTTKAHLIESGALELAKELVLIQGRFAVEELNKCISISGYAGRLYQDILAGKANCLSLEGTVVSPPG